MIAIAQGLLVAVATLHFWFMILEMFLWQKPLGLKTFRNTPEQAQTMAVLAANQGLYNGFLATGLLLGFFLNPEPGWILQIFCLACVAVAGIYGACTVNRRIFWVQTFPAGVALILKLLA